MEVFLIYKKVYVTYVQQTYGKNLMSVIFVEKYNIINI